MTLTKRVALAALVGAAALGLATFAGANRTGVGVLVDGLTSVDLVVAMLGVGCSALAIANRGMLNRAAHHAVGLDAGVATMTRTAAVGFAAQKMVKSAGTVGLAVFVRRGNRAGHSASAVTAACMLTASASFAALGALVAAAVLVLACTGSLTGWWLAAAIGFGVYAGGVVLMAITCARKRHVAAGLWRQVDRLRRRLPWGSKVVPPQTFADDLIDAVAAARSRPTALRGLVLHALAAKLLGATMLVVAVAAVGLSVSVTTTIVIYATALTASLVTIVPGGVGTVEASTLALLIGAGATAGAAALAVALFRLFDLWLPVLTGAAVARKELRHERRQASQRSGGSTTVALARIEHRPGAN